MKTLLETKNSRAAFFFIAALACAVSCTPEPGRTDTGFPSGIAMSFSASAADWGIGADGNIWQGGETFLVRLDGQEKRYIISDAASGVLSADGMEPFYWKDNKDVSIDAWYPYREGGMPEVIVRADQSTLEAYRASDYLAVSGYPVSISLSTSPLEFSHRVANVVINLEVAAEVDPGDVKVRLTNVEGTDAGSEIIPYGTGTVYRAMVPPQDMQDVGFISIEAGDYSLVYTPDSFRDGYLRADRQYTLTFAIEQDSIEFIGSVGNSEWDLEGEEETGSTEIVS